MAFPRQACCGTKKLSSMTNLAFAVDFHFLSNVKTRFPLHFEFFADAFTMQVLAVFQFQRKVACLELQLLTIR